MKNILYLILLMLFFVSCQSSDEPGFADIINNTTDRLNNDNSTENELDAPFEISIDDSDLAILQEDTGGSHTAFPLGSTSANFGHNAWTTTYNGAGRNHNQLHDKYDVDIYDWMLTYKKE